jgi:hypothetical protein
MEGGAGGGYSGGDIGATGNDGLRGICAGGIAMGIGSGGGSHLGGGGAAGRSASGSAGGTYGGGGGGQSAGNGDAARAGGAGSVGCIIITEFYGP